MYIFDYHFLIFVTVSEVLIWSCIVYYDLIHFRFLSIFDFVMLSLLFAVMSFFLYFIFFSIISKWKVNVWFFGVGSNGKESGKDLINAIFGCNDDVINIFLFWIHILFSLWSYHIADSTSLELRNSFGLIPASCPSMRSKK